MKQHPILFSTEMVQAILAGRKTETRRIIKPQPPEEFTHVEYVKCPYGQPGDILWVRETWAEHPDGDALVYKADDRDWETTQGWKWSPSIYMPRSAARIFLEVQNIQAQRLHDITEEDAIAEGILQEQHTFVSFPGKPSIWQRKDYIKSQITGVPHYSTMTATKSFSTLWDVVNGLGMWQQNPWVWVITFQKTTDPQ